MMEGLSPLQQESSPTEVQMFPEIKMEGLRPQTMYDGVEEADDSLYAANSDLGNFSDSQGALDWMSTLNYPSQPMEGGYHQQNVRGLPEGGRAMGSDEASADPAQTSGPVYPQQAHPVLSYSGQVQVGLDVLAAPAAMVAGDDAPVAHQSGGNPAGARSSVLLFDEAGSTYMCTISEGNGHIQEYYRPNHGGNHRAQWEVVERSDTTKAALHQEAGLPKTVQWQGPTLVVFAQGKQEVGKGGVLNQPTRKYYQWCETCCAITCSTAMKGCVKAKCWIAPRKWKRHLTSQTHTVRPRPPCRP